MKKPVLPTKPIITATPPRTTLVHVSKAPAGVKWLYIGRESTKPPFQASRWANPFKLTEDTPEARQIAKGKYALHMFEKGLLMRLHEIQGQTLGYYYLSDSLAGQVMAAYANALRYHGAQCPQCTKPVQASIMTRSGPGQIAEFWKCHGCQKYGFEDAGTIDLSAHE